MKLIDLELGESGVVKSIDLDPSMMRRLWDLGFTNGTTVDVLYAAPSGDPCAYKVRGTVFSIRETEAKGIEVKKVNQ
ncbi:FeoA family protein [Atopobacter phocae]|uniref:FeoA family protein n=1 Tax=Atopobacter phocae TaxID=136492 RepID=UPI00046F5539|nr:FeoA family protein [Atopobacter phocae]